MKKLILLSIFLPLFAMANYTITGKVWHDQDRDWTQNNGESNYQDVIVKLYNNTGILEAETKTNSKGEYQFKNKPEGEYSIDVVHPEHAVMITEAPLEFWLEKDMKNVNFGLYTYYYYTIKGNVWNDLNQDWERNKNELGFHYVYVHLYQQDNGKKVHVKYAMTDKEGNYEFKYLKEKEYTVEVKLPQRKTSLITESPIHLWVDEDKTNIDFGLYRATLYSIKGEVWNDANQNWEMEKNEKKVAKVMVELYKDGVKIKSQQTNSKGQYSFYGIEKGQVKIKVIGNKYTSIITEPSHELWVEENIKEVNFGVLKKIYTDIVTREELMEMIKLGDDVSKVNTSQITDMSFLCANNKTFNQDISNWDVSNVTNMSHMFYKAYKFNQNIEKWDVSSVTNMSHMFYSSTQFNQPLNNWNVSNVTDMSYMFYNQRLYRQHHHTYIVVPSHFNQSLDKWDVSNVTNMKGMFFQALTFNQPIQNWNVKNVTSWANIFSQMNIKEEYKPLKFK